MILETDRLIIREFTQEDIDLIYDINNHPECIKFNGWDSRSYEKCQEDLEEWINKYSLFPGTGAFCVESKTEQSKVGMAFIVKTDKNNEYEIGFRLRRLHWNKGYAKEITLGFINYAKQHLNAHGVIAEVWRDNVNSRNVFEKLNFSKFPHPAGEDGLVYKYKINTFKNGDGKMDKKYLFDEEVAKYEKRRPNYGTQIFKDIIEYSGITEDKSLIEIGCGTGQATESFLKTKCKITAVELGENLAAYTRKKFNDYTNLEVVQASFEEYESDDNKFDMFYSATAFHWIPVEIGYKKAYRILKSGGTLALFWNKPSVISDDPLHQKIQSIYNEFLPEWSSKATDNQNTPRYSSIDQIEQYGFVDVEFKLYHNTRTMTGAEYIELLNTYSDHIALDKSIQEPFYNAIRTAIEEYGNKIIINDTVELYLARKA